MPGLATSTAPDLQPAILMSGQPDGDLATIIKMEVAKGNELDLFNAVAQNSVMDLSMEVPLAGSDFKKENHSDGEGTCLF